METAVNHIMCCKKCGKSAPELDENGNHNFSRTNDGKGNVIDVCIGCKVEESKALWAKHG